MMLLNMYKVTCFLFNKKIDIKGADRNRSRKTVKTMANTKERKTYYTQH